MSYEDGYTFGGIFKKHLFSISTNNFTTLVRLPAVFLEQYVQDDSRDYNEYEQGEVTCIGKNKFLIQNFGRIQHDDPPRIENGEVLPRLCKLFRDKNSHDPDGTPREWVREEFCLKGFERMHNDVWYVVDADSVDDSTPPPNSQYWREK